MKKPIKADYTRRFALDSKFVNFDAQGYAAAAEKYIEFLEGEFNAIIALQHTAGSSRTYVDTILSIAKNAINFKSSKKQAS